MGKNTLSYLLLIAAAIVAYIRISDYLDTKVEDNFTTSAIIETNSKAQEIDDEGLEYKVWIN